MRGKGLKVRLSQDRMPIFFFNSPSFFNSLFRLFFEQLSKICLSKKVFRKKVVRKKVTAPVVVQLYQLYGRILKDAPRVASQDGK
jgi:hypothetical protein